MIDRRGLLKAMAGAVLLPKLPSLAAGEVVGPGWTLADAVDLCDARRPCRLVPCGQPLSPEMGRVLERLAKQLEPGVKVCIETGAEVWNFDYRPGS